MVTELDGWVKGAACLPRLRPSWPAQALADEFNEALHLRGNSRVLVMANVPLTAKQPSA
jgi:hypothetical protein